MEGRILYRVTHSNTSNYGPYVLQTYKVPNAPRTAPSENNPLQIFNEFWHVSRVSGGQIIDCHV